MKKSTKVQEPEKEIELVDEQNADLSPEEGTPKEDAPNDEEPSEEPEEEEEVSEKDSAIDKILQLNPQYEKLYIDSNGFTFTEGTSKAMRGNAKLYKNKYFKK